jgi:hypothetical protein
MAHEDVQLSESSRTLNFSTKYLTAEQAQQSVISISDTSEIIFKKTRLGSSCYGEDERQRSS